jgi:hypothetical protein
MRSSRKLGHISILVICAIFPKNECGNGIDTLNFVKVPTQLQLQVHPQRISTKIGKIGKSHLFPAEKKAYA